MVPLPRLFIRLLLLCLLISQLGSLLHGIDPVGTIHQTKCSLCISAHGVDSGLIVAAASLSRAVPGFGFEPVIPVKAAFPYILRYCPRAPPVSLIF